MMEFFVFRPCLGQVINIVDPIRILSENSDAFLSETNISLHLFPVIIFPASCRFRIYLENQCLVFKRIMCKS